MNIPEIGIGLPNRLLYPSKCNVVPAAAAAAVPPVSPVDPFQDSRVAAEILRLRSTIAELEAVAAKLKEDNLNLERRLFIESNRERAPPPQQHVLPFFGGAIGGGIVSGRVEIVQDDFANNIHLQDYVGKEPLVAPFDLAMDTAWDLPLLPTVVIADEVAAEPVVAAEPDEVAAEPVAEVAAAVPVTTTRKVDMSDLDKTVPKAGASLDLDRLIASIGSWTEKEINKLPVDVISSVLQHFGKSYIKPKGAAVKLLMKAVAER
jgi:hypothetical protein